MRSSCTHTHTHTSNHHRGDNQTARLMEWTHTHTCVRARARTHDLSDTQSLLTTERRPNHINTFLKTTTTFQLDQLVQTTQALTEEPD